jgi:predicted membrane protein
MSQETNKRVVLAGFLIVIGFFWIFKNFGLIPDFIPHYLYSWEIVFVFVGLFILLTRRAIIPGLIFIAVGLFLILPDIPQFHFIQIWMLWPILLIAIGMSLLLQNRAIPDDGRPRNKDESRDDYVDEVSIFSGGEKIITSKNFKGGKITSIFGGSEINFLNAELVKGSAYIDITAIFGGATLIVPENWNVKTDLVTIFGGFADKRTINADSKDPEESVLYIKGVVMFGGGELKSYKK